jgi:integral membrane protein (TIGR01906 family)
MKKYQKLIIVLIILFTPLMIVTSSIRVALTPLFVNIEYNLPNFPEDEYGFSMEERLDWAKYAIKYVSGRISDQDFAGQTFPDDSPLFNEREIKHMIDVRNLTVITIMFWRIFTLITILLVLFAWKEVEWRAPILTGASRGAYLTLSLIAAVLVFLTINFDQLFTGFHLIFFEGDTEEALDNEHLREIFLGM